CARRTGRPVAWRTFAPTLPAPDPAARDLFCRLLLRRLAAVDARLDFAAKMADQTLNRPGRRVAQGADGVGLDHRRHIPEQVDLALVGLAAFHPLQHAPHPATALAAGRTLSAAFVLVEIGDAADGGDDVGGLVHHDHGGGAQA